MIHDVNHIRVLKYKIKILRYQVRIINTLYGAESVADEKPIS